MSAEASLNVNYRKNTKTLTVTSGKGGVGKSSLVANLATWLGRRGNKVLIFDGDMSLANLDIMFSRRPDYTLLDVINGNCDFEQCLIEVESNVHLIPGGSGVRELNRLGDVQRRELMYQVSELPTFYDYLIIDTAPGIDDNVLFLNAAASDINVVVTPDPSSIADAYALIKVLNRDFKETRFNVICNMVRDEAEALNLFRRLSDVAEKFLCISLDYRGFIPIDPLLRAATKSQQLIVKINPQAPSSMAIREIAQKLRGPEHLESTKGGVQVFWEQVFGVA